MSVATAGKRLPATPGSSMQKMSMEKEVSEHQRRRAADQLRKSLAHHLEPPQANQYTEVQLKQLFETALKLASDNKINEKNAFDLNFIDVLPDLVQQQRAHDHFQTAGLGLDVGTRIFAKRVDAIAKEAHRSLTGKDPEGDADGDDQAGGDEGFAGGADGDNGDDTDARDAAAADARKQTSKGRRQKAHESDPSATLKSNDELRQRQVEPTFDSDPFFTRTSRLFDDNSAQSLLLHNLQVKGICHVMFDASDVPDAIEPPAAVAKEGGDVQVQVDLARFSGAKEVLLAAARATLTPSIGQLYAQLQPAKGLPGLAAAAALDLAAIVRLAQEEEHAAGARATRSAGLHQVVVEVAQEASHLTHSAGAQHMQHMGGDSSAMDVDMGGPDAGGYDGMDVDDGNIGQGSLGEQGGSHRVPQPQQQEDDNYEYSGGGDYDGRGGYSDDEGPGASDPGDGAGDRSDGDEAGANDTREPLAAANGCMMDPEDLRWLTGAAASAAAGLLTGGTAWAGGSFFRYRPPKGKAAAKKGAMAARARKSKQAVLLDFEEGQAEELQLVPLKDVCYKAKRRTRVELLPHDVDVKDTDLSGLSAKPGGDVREFWKALLLAQRAQRRMARPGPNPAAASQPGAGLGEGSDLQAGDGGASFGAGCDNDGDQCGDDGDYDQGDFAGGDGGDLDDSDDELGGQDPAQLRLEDLLAPPRRVQRMEVKYDKSAKVVDVKSLKDSILSSLVHLAAQQPQQKPQPPAARGAAAAQQPAPLPFQALLNELPRVDARAAAGGRTPAKAPAAAACSVGTNALSDVSVHLGFICVLHLANEHGLSLSNGGRLDTLHIGGLQGLSLGGARIGA